MKINKVLDKGKDLFTRRRDTRQVRALVERIQNNVNWALVGYCEHFFETLHHHPNTGLLFTIVMCQIKPVEDVATRNGLSRKMDKKRGEKVSDMLFIKIPEVEIEVRH